MTHIHSVMLYHYGNKPVHKMYSTFNAQFITNHKDPSQQWNLSRGNQVTHHHHINSSIIIQNSRTYCSVPYTETVRLCMMLDYITQVGILSSLEIERSIELIRKGNH